MKKRNIILICIISLIIISLIISIIIANFKLMPFVTNISIEESLQFKDKVVVNVNINNYFFKFNKTTYCLATKKEDFPNKNDDWVLSRNGYCSFTLDAGDYKFYLKDAYGKIINADKEMIEINKLLSIKVNKDTYYMYKGMEEDINYELVKIGSVKDEITIYSEDDNIAYVDNNKIIANDYGSTNIVIKSTSGVYKKINVFVPIYITKPGINQNKPYVYCNQFSYDDSNLIDNILFDRVYSAGYGTRAGVLAAARFITLEFAYRIPYFYENGRLENYDPFYYVDGEGRYYHKGLYLHKAKEQEMDSSFVGPAHWGCDLTNFTNWGPYVYGKKYPNGLDCSGFVTWAILNGGYDVGDIGAGVDASHHDLTDLGEMVKLSEELMSSGRVKAGDLIGHDGHIAILAGWDDNNYYIAESLNTTRGVQMTVVNKSKLVHNSIYKYIILMDNYYKEDGNYSVIWE